MNINPIQFISMMRNGGNPEQMMLSILEQNTNNNPLFSNLLNLAKNGDSQNIEQIARNIMKERGFDFDKEFQNFKNTLGIK